MTTYEQRKDREAFARADRTFFAGLNDAALSAGLEYVRAIGNARAEAAILDEIQKRRPT